MCVCVCVCGTFWGSKLVFWVRILVRSIFCSFFSVYETRFWGSNPGEVNFYPFILFLSS